MPASAVLATTQKPRFLAGVSFLQRGIDLARLEGFEPPTNGFGSHYSIRLSYRRIVCDAAAILPVAEGDGRP